MTIRELAVYSASVIAEELGLPGNAPDAVYGIRNKDLCRERLREAGFDQPVTALCRDLAQAKSFMQNNPPGPWIVKPRDGLASIGVSRIANDQELQDAIAKFGPPPPAMGSLPASDSFLIETFVDGHEFSAEGFMHDGKAHVVSLTRKVNAQDFIEVGHRIPSGLEPQTATAASDAVAEALTIAGIARGVFHVEFWVTDCGIVLGELHDRPGGDYIHALVESTRPGFELYGSLLDDLLDIPATPVPSERGACAARFLLCPPGRLRGINGWEDIKKHPSVLAADMFICPGDLVGPVADSFGRHAVFVVQGPSIDEVDALIEALSSQVTFDVG
jgi:biotin carboxylase